MGRFVGMTALRQVLEVESIWARLSASLDGDIFHVRSGAGQGGGVAAKHLGEGRADQSLAYPTEMERNLKSIYEATSERLA